MNDKILAERIQIAMKLREMSLTELSIETGITVASLSRYVKGKRVPNAIILGNIAVALSVSSDYLLGITDNTAGNSNDLINIKDLLNYCERAGKGWEEFGDRALKNVGHGDSHVSSFGAVAFAAREQELYEYQIPRVIREFSNSKENE